MLLLLLSAEPAEACCCLFLRPCNDVKRRDTKLRECEVVYLSSIVFSSVQSLAYD